MSSGETQFHMAIGSRYENIELVQAVLSATLGRLEIDDETRHWVDLSVREAVANAIQHGNRQDPTKRVEVELSVDGKELVIQIRDQGEGFDPAEISDPLLPENRLRPNGRGIFYMRSFMDELDFESQSQGGTVVTLRKRLPKAWSEETRKPQEGRT